MNKWEEIRRFFVVAYWGLLVYFNSLNTVDAAVGYAEQPSTGKLFIFFALAFCCLVTVAFYLLKAHSLYEAIFVQNPVGWSRDAWAEYWRILQTTTIHHRNNSTEKVNWQREGF